jgi:hypothetical protein
MVASGALVNTVTNSTGPGAVLVASFNNGVRVRVNGPSPTRPILFGERRSMVRRSISTAGAAPRTPNLPLLKNGTGEIPLNVQAAGIVVVMRTCVKLGMVAVTLCVSVSVIVERADRVVRVCVDESATPVTVTIADVSVSVSVVVEVVVEIVTNLNE